MLGVPAFHMVGTRFRNLLEVVDTLLALQLDERVAPLEICPQGRRYNLAIRSIWPKT